MRSVRVPPVGRFVADTPLSAVRADYLRSVAIPILEKELLTISIPDISGKAETPVGHISYDLSNVQITAATIGASDLAISTAGVSLSVSSVSLGLLGDWSVSGDEPHRPRRHG